MKSTISRMKQNARAYNKHLTDEYLDKLSAPRLLGLVSPLRRDDFKRELGMPVNEEEHDY
jgi:hypothetical protein